MSELRLVYFVFTIHMFIEPRLQPNDWSKTGFKREKGKAFIKIWLNLFALQAAGGLHPEYATPMQTILWPKQMKNYFNQEGIPSTGLPAGNPLNNSRR